MNSTHITLDCVVKYTKIQSQLYQNHERFSLTFQIFLMLCIKNRSLVTAIFKYFMVLFILVNSSHFGFANFI